jgi:type I restriction enzyme S subunit
MGEFQRIKLGLLCNLAYGKNLATDLFKSDGFDVFGANGVIGKYDKYTHSETEVLVSSRGENSGVINLSNPKSYITNNSIPGLFIALSMPDPINAFVI